MAKQRKDRKPSIEDLQFFKDLCDSLQGQPSIRKACPAMQALGYDPDPSNITTRLCELEDLLRPLDDPAFELIDRKQGRGGNAHLTDAGTEYFKQVDALLEHFNRVTAARSAPRRRVTIGGTNYVLSYIIPRLFEDHAYLESHPMTDLFFVEGEHWELVNRLQGDLDFAIGPWVRKGRDYEIEDFYEFPRALIHHPDHPFAKLPRSGPFDLRKLATETVCVLAQGHQLDLPRDLLPEPEGRGRRVTLPHYTLMRYWVQRNLAVAIAHAGLDAQYDTCPLGAIDLSEEIGTMKASFYFRPGKDASLRSQDAKDLVRMIRAYFGNYGSEKSPLP